MALWLRAFWEFGPLLPSWLLLLRARQVDRSVVRVSWPVGQRRSDCAAALFPAVARLRSLELGAGFNFGSHAGVIDEAKDNMVRTLESTGGRVSLIEWSPSGVYARGLVKDLLHTVRCVITRGTPWQACTCQPAPGASMSWPMAAKLRVTLNITICPPRRP